MKTKIIFIVFSILVLAACSSSKFVYNEVDSDKIEQVENTGMIPVSFDKIYCWINMIPGPDQIPRFYITGSISIPRSENYDIDDISLKLIKIYQNGHPYFLIKPAIRENKREKSEFQKEFIFSMYTGKKLVTGFNSDESIDVEFIFDNNGELFTSKVSDQIIEKAN